MFSCRVEFGLAYSNYNLLLRLVTTTLMKERMLSIRLQCINIQIWPMLYINCHKIHLDLYYKKSRNEWMHECVLVLLLSPCSHLSFMDKQNICLFYSLCFSLSSSCSLLFCFPSSIFIAPCHPKSIHSSLSDQREGAFFSLSLLLRRGSVDGRRRASPCWQLLPCRVPVSLELCSTWISDTVPSLPNPCMLLAATHFSLVFFFMLHVSELWMFCCF